MIGKRKAPVAIYPSHKLLLFLDGGGTEVFACSTIFSESALDLAYAGAAGSASARRQSSVRLTCSAPCGSVEDDVNMNTRTYGDSLAISNEFLVPWRVTC
jgi:hypothetical protein